VASADGIRGTGNPIFTHVSACLRCYRQKILHSESSDIIGFRLSHVCRW